MNWLKLQLYFLRCEIIYLLGGIPNEHINTVNYKNVKSIVANIRAKIEAVNATL